MQPINSYYKNELFIDTSTFIGGSLASSLAQGIALTSPAACSSLIFAGTSALSICFANRIFPNSSLMKAIGMFTAFAVSVATLPYILAMGSIVLSFETAALMALYLASIKVSSYIIYRGASAFVPKRPISTPDIKQPYSFYLERARSAISNLTDKVNWKKVGIASAIGLAVIVSTTAILQSLFSSSATIPPMLPSLELSKVVEQLPSTALVVKRASSTALVPLQKIVKDVFPFPTTAILQSPFSPSVTIPPMLPSLELSKVVEQLPSTALVVKRASSTALVPLQKIAKDAFPFPKLPPKFFTTPLFFPKKLFIEKICPNDDCLIQIAQPVIEASKQIIQ